MYGGEKRRDADGGVTILPKDAFRFDGYFADVNAIPICLKTGTADLIEQLTDLDDLVAQLEPTAPNSPSIPGRTPEAVAAFIADWKRLRKVIDAGHGPTEEDQPPTPPTPPSA